jgi:hypothetical protein
MKKLLPMLLAATCALAQTPADFPYLVPCELGEAEFAPGDNITITRVLGTSAAITTNQSFCVEGTYTLASRDQADLCLFVTTSQTNSTPIEPPQTVRITNGTGTFRLVKTMAEEGYPHVTFYTVPHGRGFGGVYFGQAPWILSKKGWSYLDKQADTAGANQTLCEYLGDPVPPPPGLNPQYTTEGLSNAVQLAASQAGLAFTRLVIDDSEFPGVIAIVIADGDIDKINPKIKAMAGYEYNGSISSSTCKVFNIVPYSAYPSDVAQRIGRRIGLRRQVLFDRVTTNP